MKASVQLLFKQLLSSILVGNVRWRNVYRPTCRLYNFIHSVRETRFGVNRSWPSYVITLTSKGDSTPSLYPPSTHSRFL